MLGHDGEKKMSNGLDKSDGRLREEKDFRLMAGRTLGTALAKVDCFFD